MVTAGEKIIFEKVKKKGLYNWANLWYYIQAASRGSAGEAAEHLENYIVQTNKKRNEI